MPSLWSPDTYQHAALFAARAHQGQLIKDTAQPFLLHLALVAAETLAALQAEAGLDGDLAVANALLHDTLEDTATVYADLQRDFGARVAEGVQALSKDKTRPAAEQMPDSLRRIQRQPREIGLVKLADRIVNLRPPPRSWTDARCAAYREEARLILAALGSASPYLAERLAGRIARYPQGDRE